VEVSDLRLASTEARGLLRVKIVQAFRAGMSRGDIMRIFGINRQTLYNWLLRAELEPVENLSLELMRGRPRGSGQKLSGVQAFQIRSQIRLRTPGQIAMPFALWTREAVRDLIERRFQIRLSIRYMGKLLNDWGLPRKSLLGAPTNATHARLIASCGRNTRR
jgi:transposase